MVESVLFSRHTTPLLFLYHLLRPTLAILMTSAPFAVRPADVVSLLLA